MANSRWSWAGFKDGLSEAAQTPLARFIYSAGAGCGVAGSVIYVGSTFPLYFHPVFIFFFAASACMVTTIVQYQKLSVNDDRIGKLEKKTIEDEKHIQLLGDRMKGLMATNQELYVATEQHIHVLGIVIPTLTDSEVRDKCEQAMEPPREERGVLIKQYRSTLRVSEEKLNPYSMYNNRDESPKSTQSDEENANQILSQDLDEFKFTTEDDVEPMRERARLLT